jgi:hypothetical protein
MVFSVAQVNICYTCRAGIFQEEELMKTRIQLFSILILFCLVGSSCEIARTSTPVEPSQVASITSAIVPTATATTEPTPTPSPTPVVSDFSSDGEPEGDWYWLRDYDQVASAKWTLTNLPSEPADINLELTALATDASQTRGLPANFYLSYGTFEGEGATIKFGTQFVTLLNTSSDQDPQGFYNTGKLSIPRRNIPSGVPSLWVEASRSPLGTEGSPVETLLAFRAESLEVTGGSLPAQMINQSIYQGGDFSSDGDFVNGWWWLRDPGHTASATWNFGSIPPGTSNLDINLQVLATDQADGAGGFNARFYISYGPIPDSRPTEEIPSYLVELQNAILADDPNGYTCKGKFTIPRADLPAGTEAIWMRISRLDAQGQNPIDLHIAFMETSVTFSEGSTTTDDNTGREDAFPVVYGTYSARLHALQTQLWYKIMLDPKDYLNLRLVPPLGADFQIVLFDPGNNRVGTPLTSNGQVIQQHIAGEDAGGIWFIKVYRVSGEGAFDLHVASGNQNDADSGGDAGDNIIPKILITTGNYFGMLMDDDPIDYYQFFLEPEQTATFVLSNAFAAEDAWSGSTIFKAEINAGGGVPITEALTQNGLLTISYTNNTENPVYKWLKLSVDSGRGGRYDLIMTNSRDSACDGTTAEATNFYTEGISDLGMNWLMDTDGKKLHSATWLFRNLPTGMGNLKFRVDFPLAVPMDSNIIPPQGKFYALYGPIPASSSNRVFGPLAVTLQTETSAPTPTGFLGWGEFSLPRLNLQNASQGYWIRIYRADPTGTGEPVDAVLGVSKPAIKLCLGIETSVSTSSPAAHPLASVTLDATNQILTSNTPIFVDPGSDMDGDGLNQNWENAAANAVNPVIEVDEEELWLKNRSIHFVVNFVRVYPWPSIADPQYIIFGFLETWSRDYGSGAQNDIYEYVKEKHDGDSEMIFEAWKVLDDNRIALEWVQTSSHYGVTNHSGVWHVRDHQCNIGNISNTHRQQIGTELLCEALEIEMPSGRVKLYTAENKHGIYPNDHLCNNARLVNLYSEVYWFENCGFDPSDYLPYQWSDSDFDDDPRYLGDGKWLWTVFNVGEPDNYLINDLDNRFEWRGLTVNQVIELVGAYPGEAVWDGYYPETWSNFCGGLGGNPPCSTRLGSKYESTPVILEEKLRSAFKISMQAATGLMASTVSIDIHNEQNNTLTFGAVSSSILNGQSGILYLPEGIGMGNADHIHIINSGNSPFNIPWYIVSINVTDLSNNETTVFPANWELPLNQEVIISRNVMP